MLTDIIITGACGRMGTTIRALAREDADTRLVGLVERPDRLNELAGAQCPVTARVEDLLPQAGGAVVIDFTAPESSLHLAQVAARTGNPLVIGTTGLDAAHMAALRELACATPIFWSPNMSIGVNVLGRILPELARMLGEGYDLEIIEVHHNRKRDAPSGTALRLAEGLAQARNRELSDVACNCRQGITGPRPQGQIGIQAVRGGDVAGVHTVYFLGQGERIEVTHHAHSRENFAQGALRAAKWLKKQNPGKLYTMLDIF